MQLIVDSEAALDIKRDMSAIEDTHSEKVVNGDIEQLIENTCNGNKENIEEVNVIINDEKNKQDINSEIEALPNSPIDFKPENAKVESSIEVVNKEETCEAKTPETNGKQKDESQSNGTHEEIQSTSPITKESEEKPKETVQEVITEDEEDIISLTHETLDQIPLIAEKELEKVEPGTDEIKIRSSSPITKESEEKTEETAQNVIVEDEEDIISLRQENLDQIPDIAEKESEKVKPKSDEIIICEDLSVTKDDVEVVKKPDTTTETISDVVMNEPEPDVKLKEPANTIKSDDNLLVCSENKDKSKESSENKENEIEIDVPVCDSAKVIPSDNARNAPPIELKDDMDVEEVVETKKSEEQVTASQAKEKSPAPVSSVKPILCKLSNTLDILSDDEEESQEEPPKEETPMVENLNEKQCINIEDDDDIMLIDEDTIKTETPQPVDISKKEDGAIKTKDKTDLETGESIDRFNQLLQVNETIDLFTKTEEKDAMQPEEIKHDSLQINVSEKQEDEETKNFSPELPLVHDNFLKSAKKNLSDMTREELEEFCILKIVESVVDRSNLSEIKNKLKTVAQGVDEYRKKVMMLTKQNRDLQVVLKSIQEEQKKLSPGTPITPLKITRSVGMQVFMERSGARRKNLAQLQNPTNVRQGTKSLPATNVRPQKPPVSAQPIPVPRLVPASPAIKSPSTIPLVNQITPSKPATPMPNGVKNPTPQKVGEKRQHNRNMSLTVDLTDDEPPTKVNNRTSPPVRVVPSQNLMANPRQPFPAAVSSPRKVYIPISAPQNQNIRPGQTIMLKSMPTPGLRQRGPQVGRHPSGPVRMNRFNNKHPAPLPDAMKQYQPPNWKPLPPAPDLKLSKVENGIVISWKMEGFQEDNYEEIASYQLYAYQETSAPPHSTLWKKIGDVKALPLPMACTLTQFMAGFRYFFAVRAVDIRSRLGPFSLPGSILLLNKV